LCVRCSKVRFQSRLNFEDGEKERHHLNPDEDEHGDAQGMFSLAPKQSERQKGWEQQNDGDREKAKDPKEHPNTSCIFLVLL
jgi:hypothetical protein